MEECRVNGQAVAKPATRKVGTFAYAHDYREDVLIVEVESEADGGVAARYCVQRQSGVKTSNYPGYLLSDARGSVKRGVR